jgi:hypothetical protein
LSDTNCSVKRKEEKKISNANKREKKHQCSHDVGKKNHEKEKKESQYVSNYFIFLNFKISNEVKFEKNDMI